MQVQQLLAEIVQRAVECLQGSRFKAALHDKVGAIQAALYPHAGLLALVIDHLCIGEAPAQAALQCSHP